MKIFAVQVFIAFASYAIQSTPVHAGPAKDASLVSCDGGISSAQPFPCRLEGGDLDIRDPEFDDDRSLVTWQVDGTSNPDGSPAPDGIVYLARVNPTTGRINWENALALSGRPAPSHWTKNGPEWGYSQRGAEAFYTCLADAPFQVELCKLVLTAGGQAKIEVLPDSLGLSLPIPSQTLEDENPKIYWRTLQLDPGGQAVPQNHGWREDVTLPDDVALDISFGLGSWLPDGSGLVLVRSEFGPGGVVMSIYHYDIATGIFQPLAADGRDYRRPIAWSAPELDGGAAVLALVLNEQTGGYDLEVYKQAGDGSWSPWNRFDPICPSYFNAFSPEPFVVEGRSYITLTSYDDVDRDRAFSIIWVTSVDPDLPAEHQRRKLVSPLSCDGTPRVFRDPEPMVTQGGAAVRIYFLAVR